MSAKVVDTGTIGSSVRVPSAALAGLRRAAWFHAVTLSLFTLTIFTSASLLFIVQPMVGKILLPKLGGVPSVWNTCMVFFQATLLLGYLLAHLSSKLRSLQWQTILFASGVMLALGTLPLAVDPQWVDRLLSGANPNAWLLEVLCVRVAPAFLVLSITSPLLQKWFARSGHPQGQDPYFLYAASNIGSILALVLYPFFLEVNLGVTAQAQLWKCGFAAFLVLVTMCGAASWWGSLHSSGGSSNAFGTPTSKASPPTWSQRGRWILLAAVPSSLMLGVTTHISTDISSIPQIWVIPLTLYLLTFVMAFARRQVTSAYWTGRIAALLLLTVSVTLVTGANDPPLVIIPLHLSMFFTVALFCHQGLAADRPSPESLRDFYLCLSVGGVLGGMFNALLAPSLFPVIAEYPLAMIAAAMLRETRAGDVPASQQGWRRVLVFGLGVFCLTVLASASVQALKPADWLGQLTPLSPLSIVRLQTLLVFGLPACLVLHNLESRPRFGLGLAALLLVSVWQGISDDSTLQRGRNFYGTIRSAREQLAGGAVVKMYHGNTVHGWQWTDPVRRAIPLTYYGKSSGVGRLIAQRQAAVDSPLRIGAIGLGAGTLAATLRSGDELVYYEINPQVLEHANRHFTYLADARQRGAAVETRLGDARLVLEAESRVAEPGQYDILVVDAFSSDSIPVHLLTTECVQSYRAHLKPDGVLAFHITNRYLNLAPVLAALAASHQLSGAVYRNREIAGGGAIDEQSGETTSCWVLLATSADGIGQVGDGPSPQPLAIAEGVRLWTDEYSNVLSAFQLRL